jgi:hypothetical protein
MVSCSYCTVNHRKKDYFTPKTDKKKELGTLLFYFLLFQKIKKSVKLLKMEKETLTVILPCAGQGSRLALKSPKELFEIAPGSRLIDFSLNHIEAIYHKGGNRNLPSTTIKIKVAVVTRPWKVEVAEYVSQRVCRFPEITVETVMFNDSYREWPGSVYSASEFFSDNNLVLLPDSYLRLKEGSEGSSSNFSTCFNNNGETLAELVLNALKEYKVVFGSVKCSDTEKKILKQLGAMRVEDGEVTAFQDKPFQNLERFNRFWGCYSFRKEYGKALYDFLIKSVLHQPVSLKKQPFYPVGTISLHSYWDLGTWENIKGFRRDCCQFRT